jgi:predicted transposase YbfD/YdcC
MEATLEKPRLAILLKHFAQLSDPREPWRVVYPLPEVLLLVVCGSICGCDDYDEIVEWGETRLDFLRRFRPYHYGLPCADWLRTLMNRLDPGLFQACFTAWVRECWPDKEDFIALDGKTSRRSHDRSRGQAALHLVSAFATNARLVLGQEAVAQGSCEQETIPVLLKRLADSGCLAGGLVTIDAIACNPTIAADIAEAGADYVLAVKDNQPSLRAEIASFFATAPAAALDIVTDVDKDHGRIETRTVSVSHQVDWMASNRRHPGEWRFVGLAALIRVEATVEKSGKTTRETRFYIASAPLSAARAAEAIRGHWRIENSLHWVLDVQFKEDLSRLRRGHGAANMAVVRHFALNIVRGAKDKRSLKRRRKRAGFDPAYLDSLLNPASVNTR